MLTFSNSITSKQNLRHQQRNERPGRCTQAPDDYDITKLDEYDVEYLRSIVGWDHKAREDLIKEAFKWQARLDSYKERVSACDARIAGFEKVLDTQLNDYERENKQLRERVAELEAENERLKRIT